MFEDQHLIRCRDNPQPDFCRGHRVPPAKEVQVVDEQAAGAVCLEADTGAPEIGMLVQDDPGIFSDRQGADPVVPFPAAGNVEPVEIGKIVVVGEGQLVFSFAAGILEQDNLEIRRVPGLCRKGGENEKENTQHPENHSGMDRCVHGSISSFVSG
ncbi:hypothetical protein SDC9_106923 [bioreactor metagenome]|uniref:Uncharacterized protein n=1 Tax=bioreactor metagenome TaxID=1076179 RepID=A0A645B4U3_9ZZZZ